MLTGQLAGYPVSNSSQECAEVSLNKKRDRPGFGYHNPPPSEGEALGRLHEIEVKVQSIEAQLQYGSGADFASPKDFTRWRSRAMGSLGFYRAEISYIERWIGARGSISGFGGPQHISSTNYRTGLEEVNALMRRATEQVSARYQRIYGEDNLPVNLELARGRKAELDLLARMCAELFGELKALAKLRGIGRDRLRKIWRPLATISEEISTERALVWRALEGDPNRIAWIPFLLSLVDRATAAGLVCTEDEQQTIETIRAARESQI